MHLDFSARVLSTMASVDPFTSSHGSRVAGTICHRQEYSTQKVKEICEPHIAEQTGITVRSMCRGRAKRRSVVLRGRSEIRRTHDWVTSISTVQFAGAGSTHTWQLRSRFVFSRSSRACNFAAASCFGMSSPVSKYISSGVCPLETTSVRACFNQPRAVERGTPCRVARSRSPVVCISSRRRWSYCSCSRFLSDMPKMSCQIGSTESQVGHRPLE